MCHFPALTVVNSSTITARHEIDTQTKTRPVNCLQNLTRNRRLAAELFRPKVRSNRWLTLPPAQISCQKFGNIRNPEVESYQLVYLWVQSGEAGGGWSPRGGISFLGGGLQKYSGTNFWNFKYTIGFLSSNPVDWHPS
jgi:hypothetical protein